MEKKIIHIDLEEEPKYKFEDDLESDFKTVELDLKEDQDYDPRINTYVAELELDPRIERINRLREEENS